MGLLEALDCFYGQREKVDNSPFQQYFLFLLIWVFK